MYEDEDPPENSQGSDEVENALIDAADNFDSSMRAKFSAVEYKALRTIGAFIMRGLSLKESCILSRVSPEKLEALMQTNDDVRAFIEFKQTAYKAALLSTVAGSAITSRQTKSAGFLLEKQYRDEFGKKNKDDSDGPTDMISEIIRTVRASNEMLPPQAS